MGSLQYTVPLACEVQAAPYVFCASGRRWLLGLPRNDIRRPNKSTPHNARLTGSNDSMFGEWVLLGWVVRWPCWLCGYQWVGWVSNGVGVVGVKPVDVQPGFLHTWS